MKLSKQVRKAHEQALSLLKSKRSLNFDEIEFIHQNLRPDATTDIGKGSAFFTPWDIVSDFLVETGNANKGPERILDLCAGFGILSHRKYLRERACGHPLPIVTCVEINPEYVAIGKELFPEAEWICADVLDVPDILSGQRFSQFFSNPPFGVISSQAWGNRKAEKPARWEYAVAEIGMLLSDYGTMICQQGITFWKYSNCRSFTEVSNPVYDKWSEKSGLILNSNCGLDCSHTPFASAAVTVDICCVERRQDIWPVETPRSEPVLKTVERTLF